MGWIQMCLWKSRGVIDGLKYSERKDGYQYSTAIYNVVRKGSHTHTLSVTCLMPFPLRVLSCVFVCCEITGGTDMGCDPGEEGKTLVSGLLSEADVSPATSIPSTGQYFVSRLPAS